jgi:hypothetical protein
MTEIAALLDSLDDPFNMFPFEAIMRQLGTLTDERYEQLSERSGSWGVSPKYYTVEDEHDYEVIRLCIGSAFVLGQASITQAVSIVTRLYNLTGNPSWIPIGKIPIMSMEATIHPGTGLSNIILFDAVANYFKHYYEWPSKWHGASGAQQRTIDIVLKLGLMPEHVDNLHIALTNIGMSTHDLSTIGSEIQNWRERMSGSLRTNMLYYGFA